MSDALRNLYLSHVFKVGIVDPCDDSTFFIRHGGIDYDVKPSSEFTDYVGVVWEKNNQTVKLHAEISQFQGGVHPSGIIVQLNSSRIVGKQDDLTYYLWGDLENLGVKVRVNPQGKAALEQAFKDQHAELSTFPICVVKNIVVPEHSVRLSTAPFKRDWHLKDSKYAKHIVGGFVTGNVGFAFAGEIIAMAFEYQECGGKHPSVGTVDMTGAEWLEPATVSFLQAISTVHVDKILVRERHVYEAFPWINPLEYIKCKSKEEEEFNDKLAWAEGHSPHMIIVPHRRSDSSDEVSNTESANDETKSNEEKYKFE